MQGTRERIRGAACEEGDVFGQERQPLYYNVFDRHGGRGRHAAGRGGTRAPGASERQHAQREEAGHPPVALRGGGRSGRDRRRRLHRRQGPGLRQLHRGFGARRRGPCHGGRGRIRAARRPEGVVRRGQIPDFRRRRRPRGDSRDGQRPVGSRVGLRGARKGHEHRGRHRARPQGRDAGPGRRDRHAQVPVVFRRQEDLRRRRVRVGGAAQRRCFGRTHRPRGGRHLGRHEDLGRCDGHAPQQPVALSALSRSASCGRGRGRSVQRRNSRQQ